MIIPEIKAIINTRNMDYLNTVTPENPCSFAEFIEVAVGELGKMGSDNFTFCVCNLEYLKSKSRENKFLFLNNYILIEKYDPKLIEDKLKLLINSINAENWGEFAIKLGKYGRWEFDENSTK